MTSAILKTRRILVCLSPASTLNSVLSYVIRMAESGPIEIILFRAFRPDIGGGVFSSSVTEPSEELKAEIRSCADYLVSSCPQILKVDIETGVSLSGSLNDFMKKEELHSIVFGMSERSFGKDGTLTKLFSELASPPQIPMIIVPSETTETNVCR